MSNEDEAREASGRFYSALNSMAVGDSGPMSEAWSHSEIVTTMHPIGSHQTGWPAVQESFNQVAGVASDGHVEIADQVIVAGDDFAYETGIERGDITVAGQSVSFEQRVTNIYRREADGWKIVHHHTDISPEMVALMERLQGEQKAA